MSARAPDMQKLRRCSRRQARAGSTARNSRAMRQIAKGQSRAKGLVSSEDQIAVRPAQRQGRILFISCRSAAGSAIRSATPMPSPARWPSSTWPTIGRQRKAEGRTITAEVRRRRAPQRRGEGRLGRAVLVPTRFGIYPPVWPIAPLRLCGDPLFSIACRPPQPGRAWSGRIDPARRGRRRGRWRPGAASRASGGVRGRGRSGRRGPRAGSSRPAPVR